MCTLLWIHLKRRNQNMLYNYSAYLLYTNKNEHTQVFTKDLLAQITKQNYFL